MADVEFAQSSQRSRILYDMWPRRMALALLSVGISACDPLGHLVSFSMDDVEASLEAPTGALENTDALGLAYTVFASHLWLRAVLVTADQLPGVHRFRSYSEVNSSSCAAKVGLVTHVDYLCLGYAQGALEISAREATANDNGDYDLTLEEINLSDGQIVDGRSAMRVAGVAHVDSEERAIFTPIARLDGLPEDFEGMDRVALRITGGATGDTVEGVAEILGETYVFHVTRMQDVEMTYVVRDTRNLWRCRSAIDGRRLIENECQTPVGQGDYAVLRF